jgi:hypothetical protein
MAGRLVQPGTAAAAADGAGPGPGEYHSEAEGVAAAKGPAFSIAGRLADGAGGGSADVPGPGGTVKLQRECISPDPKQQANLAGVVHFAQQLFLSRTRLVQLVPLPCSHAHAPGPHSPMHVPCRRLSSS